jgi:threonine/homoserine/homoserine lactone efflux protein
VSQWLVAYQAYLRVAGGLALLWLGWRALRTPPAHDAASAADSTRMGRLYSTAVGLTLTNPMTIMAFVAIFAGAGLVAQPGTGTAVLVTVGVALGSLSWWLALVTVVWAVRRSVSERAMLVVNRISGAVLIAFGLLALVTGVDALV